MKQRTLSGLSPARRLLSMLSVCALLGVGALAQNVLAQTAPPATAPAAPAAQNSRSTPVAPLSARESQELNDLFTKLRPATLRLEECPLVGPCSEPEGVGSGFLISADGLALTAYHVVFQARNLQAVTSDRKRYPVTVIGFDDQHDIALVKVGVPSGTPFFPLALNSPAANDLALVIGNGNGQFLRPRTGRLLSLEAQAGRADFPPGTLEMSVPLVPGDSGGPVINAKGEAVGVVSYISLNSLSRRITSYAVPVTVNNALLADLRRGVKNEAPLIGITILPELSSLDEEEFAQANRILKLGLGDTPGAFFLSVTPGSPAAQAGLKPMRIDSRQNVTPGDVVTAVNGKRIINFSEFQYAVRQHRPGETITLTVLRDGKELKVSLTLAPRSQLTN